MSDNEDPKFKVVYQQPIALDYTGPCKNCGKRPGTEIWAPGGTIAYVHGVYSMWCTVCCLEAQLKYAREQAEAIPGIEAKLREALKS